MQKVCLWMAKVFKSMPKYATVGISKQKYAKVLKSMQQVSTSWRKLSVHKYANVWTQSKASLSVVPLSFKIYRGEPLNHILLISAVGKNALQHTFASLAMIGATKTNPVKRALCQANLFTPITTSFAPLHYRQGLAPES